MKIIEKRGYTRIEFAKGDSMYLKPRDGKKTYCCTTGPKGTLIATTMHGEYKETDPKGYPVWYI